MGRGADGMPMFRKSMIVLLLIALVAGGGALYGMQAQSDATVLDAATQPAASSSGDDGASQDGGLTVYVTGAVNQPGVVTVASGARIADAVNACGGLSPEADAEGINMAQAVKDGQQIRVPAKGAQKAAANGGNGTTSAKVGGSANSFDAGGLVNINTADEKALDTLPGVGPATAQKIIEYRENEGAFQSPEDIMKVRGIGKAKYEKMKDKITI